MRKKIFTSGAFVVFITSAWAQNTATLNQFGTEQTAGQTQTGNQQVSVVAQRQADGLNVGNWATTHQTGTLPNTAIIQQNNGSQHNRSSVTQVGAEQWALADQLGEVSLNDVLIRQSGGNNRGAVFQQYMSHENNAALSQSGSGNEAELHQRNQVSQNEITVTQTGTDGSVFVRQSYGEVGSSAVVWQSGDRNEAELYQQSGSDNTATIDQLTSGSDNYAFVYQGDTFAFSGSSGPVSGNTTTLTQRGSGNRAELWTMGSRNTLTVQQTGDANFVRGVIGGQFSFDHVGKQLGDDNVLTVSQTSSAGGAGHMARIQQMGQFNASTIQQAN